MAAQGISFFMRHVAKRPYVQGKRIKIFEFIPTGGLVLDCLLSTKLVFA